MTIDVKTSGSVWSSVLQPYYKLGVNDWRALKRVMYKNAAGWQEVWPSVIVYIHTGYGYNMNMHACFGYPANAANYIFINDGKIGSNSDAVAALVTGNFPAGSNVTLINNGLISGKGGDSACFTSGSGAVYHARPGGLAFQLSSYVTLQNNGQINGGGGGGGATGDFAGSTRHNASGGGGAGIVVGRGNPAGFGGYPTVNGTETAGGVTPGYGNGGNPGQNGTYATVIVNNDLSKMLFGAAGGMAILYTGYIKAGSVMGVVNGRQIPGLAGSPYIRQTGFAGDGNYGSLLYIDVESGGSGPVTSASFISDGANIALAKVSATRFSMKSTQSTSTVTRNTWRTGTVRFTVNAANGSSFFDLALKVGDAKKPYEPRSCFPAGCMVTMADGTERPIESIMVGEMVRTAVGVATVTGLDYPNLGDRPMYAFEGGLCRTSGEHSVWGREPGTDDQWWTTRDMEQWLYEAENGFGPDFDRRPIDLTLSEGRVWEFATLDGWKATKWQRVDAPADTQLYHLLLDEGGSYYVDGYLVSSMADSGGVDWETFIYPDKPLV